MPMIVVIVIFSSDQANAVYGMNGRLNWPRNRLLLALSYRNLKQLMPEFEPC